MFRIALLVLILATTQTSAFAAGRKLAVVVGVDVYRTNAGLPDLKHASNDATELSNALRSNGFKVYEMTHAVARQPGKERHAPTLAYIRDQIKGILEFPNLGRNDSVVISFHGHGVQYKSEQKGKNVSQFYFCPADATVDGITKVEDITEKNHLLPLDELYGELENCKAAVKLLIVDACRNDPTQQRVFRDTLPSATLPALPPPKGGTAAFFSCRASQKAVEDPKLKHGVFTYFLVKGLMGKADQPLEGKPADGTITLSELSTYVANNTYAHVYDEYQTRQSPELRGNFDLNLPIARMVAVPSVAGIKFVRIPSGSFMMGSNDGSDHERPVHKVTITKPFFAGKYEVTVRQILTWLNSRGVLFNEKWIDLESESCPIKKSGSRFVLNSSSKFGESEQQPMVEISWYGAKAFCDWCSQQDTRFTYRLPSEAEWEYMARAGSTSAYPWGDSLNGRKANIAGNSPHGTPVEGPYLKKTTKVGAYRPNDWGLYDTVGNVWEWCEDAYDDDFYGTASARQPDPLNRSEASRVLRGGSWYNGAIAARSAFRDYYSPDYRYFDLGFRVVAE